MVPARWGSCHSHRPLRSLLLAFFFVCFEKHPSIDAFLLARSQRKRRCTCPLGACLLCPYARFHFMVLLCVLLSLPLAVLCCSPFAWLAAFHYDASVAVSAQDWQLEKKLSLVHLKNLSSVYLRLCARLKTGRYVCLFVFLQNIHAITERLRAIKERLHALQGRLSVRDSTTDIDGDPFHRFTRALKGFVSAGQEGEAILGSHRTVPRSEALFPPHPSCGVCLQFSKPRAPARKLP